MKSQASVERRLAFWEKQRKYYRKVSHPDEKVVQGLRVIKAKINILKWVLDI